MSELIQSLELRRLMSAALPLSENIVDEPVSEYAGISSTLWIARMPAVNPGHVSQLHGGINWGDGTSSPAGFARDKNGGIDIVATHAYTKPGTFSITTGLITETPYPGPNGIVPEYILLLGSASTTATVTTAPPQLTQTLHKSFTATLGTFNQFTLDVSFTAKINWGDGNTTTAQITGGDLDQGNWQIQGTHSYGSKGNFIVHAYVYSHVVPGKTGGDLFDVFTTLIHVV